MESLESDIEKAPLGRRRLEMLRYAVKLTKTPGEMTEDDVDTLRETGFSDRDILQIVEVVAYYAYANRIADGLGIRLEEDSSEP